MMEYRTGLERGLASDDGHRRIWNFDSSHANFRTGDATVD
jgi:hypothetical protein